MASGTSYNGWPANSDKNAIGVVSSEWFPGGVKSGDVTTVLRYVTQQFNARVEPVVGGWCWGYTYKANANNPNQLSCHASGTAIDANAPDHPNGSGGTFTDAQVGQIYAILDEVQGAVDWLESYDEMHFEIAVNASDLAAIAATLPAGGGPAPPPQGDWFDMASKEDLAAVVWEQINRPEFLAAVATTVWTKVINDKGAANALLNSAAVNAEWAVAGIADLPTNVWITPITDDTDAGRANALLAKAAAG